MDQKSCPACSVAMRGITESGVLLDFCDHCNAVWLDPGELRSLLGPPDDVNLAAAETLTPNKDQVRWACPKCESDTFGMIRRDGSSIHVCSICGGTFIASETLDQLSQTEAGAPAAGRLQSLGNTGLTLEGLIELLSFFMGR